MIANGNSGLHISKIISEPCSRSLIVGWTGSGKSTLLEVMINTYRKMHPDHWLYIFDPKERYLGVQVDSDRITNLFPDGYDTQIIGRRKKVPIIGRNIQKPSKPNPRDGVYIVTDVGDFLRLCDWLIKNSDVNTPTLLNVDESIDLMKGVLAHQSFRRISQLGRELGIGLNILNQRPTYIDGTWISESQNIYMSSLMKVADRRRVYDNIAVPDDYPLKYHKEGDALIVDKTVADFFDEPLEDYQWIKFDQHKHSATGPFTLGGIK